MTRSCWLVVVVRACACVALSGPLFVSEARGEDWPVYRHDPAHSNATRDKLQLPLAPHWVYAAPAAIRRAWEDDDGRIIEGKDLKSRLKFDDALQAVVAEGRVYFSSPVDHQLHCHRADTGAPLWTFHTDGAVRLAPAVSGGRVYFGSDDGYAYCVQAETGALVWRRRPSQHDEWLLGQGELLSRWPVRTGVLEIGGVAYFGAGIFPHEDVYLCAADALTGKLRWLKNNVSETDAARNDLSPQGSLLAVDDRLIVPSARSLPAVFRRETGELLFKKAHAWRTSAGGVVGGIEALVVDDQIVSLGAHHAVAMDEEQGNVGYGWFKGQQMAVMDDKAYLLTGKELRQITRQAYAEGSRVKQAKELEILDLNTKMRAPKAPLEELKAKIAEKKRELAALVEAGVDWNVPCTATAQVAVAGDLVLVGGAGEVAAHDRATGERRWSAAVEGDARVLVAAGGRLLVSTTAGKIYAFAEAASAPAAPREVAPRPASPFAEDALTPVYAAAARQILEETGVRAGYCLILGSDRGRLACELARQSELRIYGIESDAERVAAARQALSTAGLYGHRVAFHHADAGDMPHPNYFANLIVSDRVLTSGQVGVAPQHVARVLKPNGGVVCLGFPTGDFAAKPAAQPSDLSAWLAGLKLDDQAQTKAGAAWVRLVRGKLPGAGSWTHLHGSPTNSASSDDQLVKGPLGVLWYGEPGGNKMVNRHTAPVGPLSVNGRLFVQGESTIGAYDAYNGRQLWEIAKPGPERTRVLRAINPGNLAASEDRLFVMVDHRCFEIDAATGKQTAAHVIPEKLDPAAHEWGFLAYQDGILFGLAVRNAAHDAAAKRRGENPPPPADTLFAIDVATGRQLWAHTGQSIPHSTIALGPDRVFFVDSSITAAERERILKENKSELAKLTGEAAKLAEERAKKVDLRQAAALDARTGKLQWSKAIDVTDCSEIGIGGGKLTLMYGGGALVLAGANANGHYWPQFLAGEFKRRRLVALDSGDGRKLWAKDANYRHRPIIVGDRLIAEPWAFHVYTGEQEMRQHPLTNESVPWSIMRTGHHCGMLTGTPNLLMFRSGSTGFYDLKSDTGTQHFGGHRLGCWINAVPANGLVMMPEAAAGCVCLYSIESTIVLQPRPSRNHWSIYSSVGAVTPVKQMAVNLGAPGDRRDVQGRLWIGYPRPLPYKATGLELAFDLQPVFAPSGGYRIVDSDDVKIAGAETPWLFTSWAQGLSKFSLPLRGPKDGSARYRVKLYFAEPEDCRAGQRKFDVSIQGQAALRGFDILAVAGQPRTAVVREFGGIEVADRLTLELTTTKDAELPPVLQAIEVSMESE